MWLFFVSITLRAGLASPGFLRSWLAGGNRAGTSGSEMSDADSELASERSLSGNVDWKSVALLLDIAVVCPWCAVMVGGSSCNSWDLRDKSNLFD
jgi:hypothetical protein